MPNFCVPVLVIREKRTKKEMHQKESVFKFFNDPEKRGRWIARVPREDWHANENYKIYLCGKHFATK